MAEIDIRQLQLGNEAAHRRRIIKFEIEGLFGRPTTYQINFPIPDSRKTSPTILILAGPNGSGKTTILRMIDGLLKLDFDTFRRVPFKRASLLLDTGDVLGVEKVEGDFPIIVTFGELKSHLARDKGLTYPPEYEQLRKKLRDTALPVLKSISYSLLDIHRSIALRRSDEDAAGHYSSADDVYRRVRRNLREESPDTQLSQRVLRFVTEAQLNYRRFFIADQLELLPRILKGLNTKHSVTKASLLTEIQGILDSADQYSRLGLLDDRGDLKTLADLLSNEGSYSDSASLAVFSAYTEMAVNQHQTRSLIAKRLINFESIMSQFLEDKKIEIDSRLGLRITSANSPLQETELSSGEYHFLFMMVSALLCQREGSIIAIDEPEMSLHVTWQRKVVDALAECAEGASALFVFATHSAAISAEHPEHVQLIGVQDRQ